MTKKSFCNVPEWNALMLSMSFYFLFGAFNTLQSYATSYYPTVGSVSYGIVYLTSPFASPFAPLIINKLDFKYSLLLAFVIYSTYNASYFIENNIFYLIMSFLCGFIAPTMWTCQGAYLTQCCNVYEYQHKIKYNSQIGWFKGLFYSLFACHTTSGYLFAALYFQFNDSNHTFFFICTLISFGAIIFILLFRYMPQQKYIQSIDINKNEQNDLQNNLVSEQNSINNPENIQQNKKDTVKLVDVLFKGWADRKLQCLIVLAMYSGELVAFIFGEFPSLITNTKYKFYAMTCYGVFGTIAAYIFGIITDKYGAIPVTLLVSFLNLIVYGGILYGNQYGFDMFGLNEFYIWLTLAAILGISGPIIGQETSILFAKLLGNNPIVFAKRSLLGGIPAAAGFFYQPYLSLEIKMIINISLCVVGVCTLFWYPGNRLYK
eukprot:218562_1